MDLILLLNDSKPIPKHPTGILRLLCTVLAFMFFVAAPFGTKSNTFVFSKYEFY